MSDQQKKQVYNYEIEYATDREGGKDSFLMKEVPYDVYKAAKGFFVEHPDKALRLILNACADEEGKNKALGYIDANSIVAIQSIETALAQLLSPIQAEIKKK